MKHGTVEATRQIGAPRATVYEAWTALEHRRQWFAGPAWTEIERSMDLQVGGREVAHGRFESGIETIYTARFHLIEPRVRLIYAFDMHVDGGTSRCPRPVSSSGTHRGEPSCATTRTPSSSSVGTTSTNGRKARTS